MNMANERAVPQLEYDPQNSSAQDSRQRLHALLLDVGVVTVVHIAIIRLQDAFTCLGGRKNVLPASYNSALPQ